MSSFSFGRTSTHSFKRILNRKQIFRHHRLNHNTATDISIDEALVGQDPYKRIRFEFPLSVAKHLASGRLNVAHQFWHHARWMEPHLLPFWQVHLLCDQKSTIQYYNHANGMVEPGPTSRYFSSIGMAMAAVPKDHWASGIFVPWTVWLSSEKLQKLFDYSRSNGLGLLPSQSSSIYTTPSIHLKDPVLSSSLWNPNVAPKFAFGPPDLRGKEEKIVSLQANQSDDQKVYQAIVPYGIRVYAIPVYRLMYRVGLRKGVGVMDALSPAMDINTFRLNWPQGELRTMSEELYRTIGHHQRRMTALGNIHETDMINAAFVPRERIDVLVRTLFDSMWDRGPINASMWENERILPEYGSYEDGTASALLNYNEECLLGQKPGPEPLYPIKKVESAPRTTLFNLRNSKTNLKAKNNEPDTDNHNEEKAQSSTNSQTSGSTSASRTFSGQSISKRRNLHYKEQAGIRLSNLRKQIRLTAEEDYIIRLPTFLPDPKNHYKNLNISEPTKDYLRLDKRDYIDDLISEQKIMKSFVDHPDRGGSHEKMIQTNEAFSNLETLEKRRKYYADSKLGFRLNRTSNKH